MVSSDSLEHKGKDMSHMAESNENLLQYPSNQQPCNSLNGPIGILWDIENCHVPSDVRPEDVAGNVIRALRVHAKIRGPVMMFSAYGDFRAFPRRLREGCQRTGVKLVDVPNGRKDAADKAILVDMFLFALDNPPPSSIMLISGDVDFSTALHILGQRGYTVILVIPAGVGVSSALMNAGKFVWDWPSVARGEGCVLSSKALIPPCVAPTAVAECPTRSYMKDNLDGENEIPRWFLPGDSKGHRSLMVKLIELSDGRLPLTRVQAVYRKHFGRPLNLSGYVGIAIVNLICMDDTFAVEGRGHTQFVCLRNWKAGPSTTPLKQAKNDKKGKGVQEENVDVTAGCQDMRKVASCFQMSSLYQMLNCIM